VRKILLLTLLLLLFFALAANASQMIINFDDLQGDNLPVPDGYGNVTWYNQWTYYGFVQDPYNAHSPPNRVYTGNADAMFTFNSPEVFDGAWFAGQPTTNVQFQGYLNGTLEFTSSSLTTSSDPTFLSSGYAGMVDTIHVLSNAPDFYVMDDVTYETGGVPEPGSLVLMGTGLVGFAGYLRRKF